MGISQSISKINFFKFDKYLIEFDRIFEESQENFAIKFFMISSIYNFMAGKFITNFLVLLINFSINIKFNAVMNINHTYKQNSCRINICVISVKSLIIETLCKKICN